MYYNTFIVRIWHKDAIESEYIRVSLPECISQRSVEIIARDSTKYNVSVSKVKECTFTKHCPFVHETLDDMCKALKEIKLYRLQESKETTQEVIESRGFRMSSCFKLVENGVSCCPFDNLEYTFFKVESTAKDVILNTRYIKESLLYKEAKNGWWYLEGKWKFVQDPEDKTRWIARRLYERVTIKVNKEEI